MATLSSNQQSVVKQFIGALVLNVTTLVVANRFLPLSTPTLPSLTERLVYTLRWQIFEVLVFLAGIFYVANTRFLTRQINPLVKKDIELLDIPLRYTQNTLEQLIISLVGKWILASYMDEVGMKLIPVLVFLFVFARIVFWIGYTIDPMFRGVGFAMTMQQNTGLVCYAVYCIVVYGSTYNL
ncbi:transmembrane protein 79-like [Glandiceps talaboti]